MGNIVVLSGSVRNGGNTELLVQAFVDGARKNIMRKMEEL